MNAFEAEMSESARQLKLHYVKLPVARGASGRAVQKSPYDAFTLGRCGRHVALEYKSQRLFGRFDLARVSEHQVAALNQVVQAGGLAFLVVNMRRERVAGRAVARNRAWYLNWRCWDRMLESVSLKERKSIPEAWFAGNNDFFTPLQRVTRRCLGPGVTVPTPPVWDLSPLLDE